MRIKLRFFMVFARLPAHNGRDDPILPLACPLDGAICAIILNGYHNRTTDGMPTAEIATIGPLHAHRDVEREFDPAAA
jgi:hypothetical protein